MERSKDTDRRARAQDTIQGRGHAPSPNTPEPDPRPNDSTPVWDLVIADMRERDHEGRRKYGVPLQAGNGRDPLVDAYQEALDLAVYLRQAIAERGGQASESGEPPVVWTKRAPIGRDPFYVATLGGLSLDVRVACECFWEWSVDSMEEGELARGSIAVDVDEDQWDYQGVEEAQARAVAVARMLLRWTS